MRKMMMWIIFAQIGLGGCNISSQTPVSVAAPTEVPDQNMSSNQNSLYEQGVSGRAATLEGIPYSFQSFTSRDGVSISVRVEHYPSKARAAKAFLRQIRTSAELLEDGPKLDSNGQEIGKRGVFTWMDDQTKKLYVTVQWNEESSLYVVETLSLQHAVEFEKWYLRRN